MRTDQRVIAVYYAMAFATIAGVFAAERPNAFFFFFFLMIVNEILRHRCRSFATFSRTFCKIMSLVR